MRDTKVDQLGGIPAVRFLLDQNVVWFQIAMHHTSFVCVGERARNREPHLHRRLNAQPSLQQNLPERYPRHKFEDEVREIFVDTLSDQFDEVRVVETSDHLCFAFEPAIDHGVEREAKELDRDLFAI